jgi:hydrogenase maturation protease
VTTAIIGIGSPFGGDQAGWDAVDALAEETWVQARLAAGTLVLEKLDRPGMALLEHLRGHTHVILIDAVLSAEHGSGTWLALQREELALLASPASSHGIGVAETLAMGEALGLLPEKLEVWGIAVAALS